MPKGTGIVLAVLGIVVFLILIFFLVSRTPSTQSKENLGTSLTYAKDTYKAARRAKWTQRQIDQLCGQKCKNIVIGYGYEGSWAIHKIARCKAACQADFDRANVVGSIFSQMLETPLFYN